MTRLPGLLAALVAFSPICALAQDQAAFDAFRDTFRATAIAEGIDPAVYDREMASAALVPIVKERDANQPEFSRPIWAYLDSAVSDTRIANGLEGMAAQSETLAAAAEKYGVDAQIIAAIWGLESAYGRIMGDHDILSVTATLAHDGRRQRYGRQQLIGALEILEAGYADRSQLQGSWAGAMGQTQFIPTTYLAYAIDENGDGRRDLWATHADVFASTANYLAKSGYTYREPWGIEVVLPDGFDFSDARLGHKKPVAAWASGGVTAASGKLSDRADLNAEASVIVPAGAAGPAFMVFDNFRAIMRYNNSTAYALGIGRLSDALAGRSLTLAAEWPRDDRPLSQDERMQLQQALADRGYDPGPVDGIVGAGTQAALRAWQADQGLAADGYASAKTLGRLLGS